MHKPAFMLTSGGRMVDVAALKPEDIDIGDIARALSKLCRFGGHTRRFYSVAQHCWHASYLVPARDALAALLHDAAEAYVVDMPTPIKRLLPNYEALEDRVHAAIAERFNLPYPWPESVTKADAEMLAIERNLLMPFHAGWTLKNPWPDYKGLPNWSPAEAEWQFIRRFETFYYA